MRIKERLWLDQDSLSNHNLYGHGLTLLLMDQVQTTVRLRKYNDALHGAMNISKEIDNGC